MKYRLEMPLELMQASHPERWQGRQHSRFGHHEMREGGAGGPGQDHGLRGRRGGGGLGRGHHGSGGGPGRARRGEARYILLDALQESPKHGYEIIKTIEERSGGQYAPSPGTVYPTMQYLEDLGLVQANTEGERRVYQLTAAGAGDLESHKAEVAEFWARYSIASGSPGLQREIEFLRQELEDLSRAVLGGRSAGGIAANGSESIRAVRAALEKCKNDVRDIIAHGEGLAES